MESNTGLRWVSDQWSHHIETTPLTCNKSIDRFQYDGNIGRNSANIYMFKVNNTNTRNRCKMCSKLTVKIPGQCHTYAEVRFQWSCFATLLKSNFTMDVKSFWYFIVNFEHISHLSLVFLLLTLNKLMLTM